MVDPYRFRQVTDVKQRDLGSEPLSDVRRVLSYSQQKGVCDWVKIRGVAHDFEFSEHFRRLRLRQIDGVQRVGLAERYDRRYVAKKTDRINPFSFTDVANSAYFGEPTVSFFENGHETFAGHFGLW